MRLFVPLHYPTAFRSSFAFRIPRLWNATTGVVSTRCYNTEITWSWFVAFCFVRYCTVLYWTELNCTIPYVLNRMYYTILYCTVLYCKQRDVRSFRPIASHRIAAVICLSLILYPYLHPSHFPSSLRAPTIKTTNASVPLYWIRLNWIRFN